VLSKTHPEFDVTTHVIESTQIWVDEFLKHNPNAPRDALYWYACFQQRIPLHELRTISASAKTESRKNILRGILAVASMENLPLDRQFFKLPGIQEGIEMYQVLLAQDTTH